MKIFVSAAEISSDIHAEKILRSLVSKLQSEGQTVQIAGIGGPRLRGIEGFECIEPAENLRVMGFTEVLGRIFQLRRILNETAYFLENYQPDLILTFDYPDFHLRLMKKIKSVLPHALKICGIPPKVWVWRSHRVEKIRELYDGVWVIFPFEKKFYEDHGIPVIYEGNPLIAALLKNDAADPMVQKKLFDASGALLLTVMPGSREAEWKHHLPILPAALGEISKATLRKIRVLVPIPEGLQADTIRNCLRDTESVTYEFREGESRLCLQESSIGLIKSGTSTLEAAVLGCVPVIFYRVSRVSELIFQNFVKYLGPVGLPNILLGIQKRADVVFPELLGPAANPTELSREVTRLVYNAELLREKQELGYRLRAMLAPASDISEKTAVRIREWMNVKPFKTSPSVVHFYIRLISFLWSSVNWFRRRLKNLGIIRANTVKTDSILVGNIQAGGAGKTPLVIELARHAVARGKKVAVLSRGYHSESEHSLRIVLPGEYTSALQVGDEPMEIRNAVPGVVLGIGKNRNAVLAALPAVDLILFDDGFQNLKFNTKVTIIAKTKLTPSQIPYRDFESELRFADFIVQKEELVWEVIPTPRPIWIFCGVASPEELASFYRKQGFMVQRLIAQPDHARFRADEVRAYLKDAADAGAQLAVTEKDFTKLAEIGFSPENFLILKRTLVSKEWIEAVFERLQWGSSSDKLD